MFAPTCLPWYLLLILNDLCMMSSEGQSDQTRGQGRSGEVRGGQGEVRGRSVKVNMSHAFGHRDLCTGFSFALSRYIT